MSYKKASLLIIWVATILVIGLIDLLIPIKKKKVR